MKISPKGRDLIAEFEGLRLTAYLCPAGVWTIGYGHTRGVKPGDTLDSPTHAKVLLDEDLAEWAADVAKLLEGTNTTQHEFDAMGSLAFNIGVPGFSKSTVLRLHKAGDKNGAARAFGMWNKATVNGKLVELAGLTRRRAAEAALYLTPDMLIATQDAPALPMPQEVKAEVKASSSQSVIAGGVSVAAGASTIAAQIDTITPVIQSVTTFGASLNSVMKLGALTLSIVAFVAVGYMLIRYIIKKRRGEIVSS
ncbi:MAG: glycoside hydrolase family 24 [Microvirga sp.]|jgi:lysozyme|nr:glycoside hydrolase family 24 [Microvirga sp.]MDF2969601.1 glycoside hydrolase family 24 [Microvirga sp.]